MVCSTLTSFVLVGGFRPAVESAEDEGEGEGEEDEATGGVTVTVVAGAAEGGVTGCVVGPQPTSRARGTSARGTRVRGTRVRFMMSLLPR
jgi:hypothetical protein